MGIQPWYHVGNVARGVVLAAAVALCVASGAFARARAATAATETPAFVPAPRTIADITAVLDQQKPDAAKIAERQKLAAAEPPAGSSGRELAIFYRYRGGARNDLGRIDQALMDMRKAAEIIQQQPQSVETRRILEQLANFELAAGNARTALALRERIVGLGLGEWQGWGPRVVLPAILATWSARLGDLEAANAYLAKADAAGESYKAEMRNWRSAGMAPLWFRDQARGDVLDYSGRYADAEPYLRRVLNDAGELIEESKKWPIPPPPEEAEDHRLGARQDLATNLLHQGRLAEAEVEARRNLLDGLKQRGRYANSTAGNVRSLAIILQQEGRYAEAETLSRIAIDTYIGVGHAPESLQLNGARAVLMSILLYERRWQEAMEQFDLLRKALAQDPARRDALTDRNIGIVIAAIRLGRAAEALDLARSATQRVERTYGEKHYQTAETRGFYATALAAAGDRAAALREYQNALPALLAASRRSESEEESHAGRDVRLKFILEGYLGALIGRQAAASPTEVAEAFRIADAARGQAVQRAVAESAARATVKDPALAELVRREQDSLRQVGALNGLLASVLGLPPDQQDPKALAGLRLQIDRLRGSRATVREEIERRFPDYIKLIDPRPATVPEVQAALRPGEALIATYLAEDRAYVWAVPKQGAVAFAAAPLARAELEAMVTRLRKSLEPNASTLGDIPSFDVALAQKLFQALLAPVSAGWQGAKSLLVVGHGALAELPLGLLVTAPATLAPEREGQPLFAGYKDVPWLIRQVAVTQWPSVASVTALRATPAAAGQRRPFVGFGDPWFNPQQAADARREIAAGAAAQPTGTESLVAMRGMPIRLRNIPKTEGLDSAQLGLLPRLPDTAVELREVAQALGGDPEKDVFLGERASEQAVRSMTLDDRKVVMFATHGLVPGDLNGLTEPALALSAPQVAGGKGDGLLTMSKVLGLRLNADWVVLSACNTAAGNGAGAEAVSGLGLAFFYAGTRALLVSNWPVETTSARALTTDLFRRQAADPRLGRAEALRQAMLGLLDGPGAVDPRTRRALFSYAHPIFWAPFSLVGDGGGAQPG